MRRDIWTQRFWCYQFDPTLEQIFEQESQCHEMVECLLAGDEFHEEVNVAVGALFAARK